MSAQFTSIGVDIIEVERIYQAAARWQDRFLNRIYTRAEREDCGRRWNSLAARFAAKEAVLKTLGNGKGISWHDIEVKRHDNDAPYICLYGNASAQAERLGIRNFALSLSHTEKYAVAVTIANV